MSKDSSQSMIESLRKQIEHLPTVTEVRHVGEVKMVADGVALLSGLSDVMMGEMVYFPKQQSHGFALNLTKENVGVVVLGDWSQIEEGDTVESTGKVLQVPVGEELVGRVIDPLGRPLDGKGEIKTKEKSLVEKIAPGVMLRQSVRQPVQSGVKAIDSMIPNGRGQRELIIGDRGTGKTAIVLDIIINQLQDNPKNPPVCIYVAIGQKESKVAKIVETLKNAGAMEYTIVVSASASSPAAFWYLAPFAGCAIGEYFRDKGKDAVVIYDDLSKHAWSYRQISLLLRRPPGREAYPGDVF